eukprot:11889282-Prorocentrum_lima.AAC.1
MRRGRGFCETARPLDSATSTAPSSFKVGDNGDADPEESERGQGVLGQTAGSAERLRLRWVSRVAGVRRAF